MIDFDKILKEKGISQVELSKKIDMAPQNLNRILKNDDIKLSTLIKIANAIEIPIYSLFNESMPAYNSNSLIMSQQRTIENLSETIKNLTTK